MYKKEIFHIETCDEELKEILKEFGKKGILYSDTKNGYELFVPIGIYSVNYPHVYIEIFISNPLMWEGIRHYYNFNNIHLNRSKEKYLYKHFKKDILMVIKNLYGL